MEAAQHKIALTKHWLGRWIKVLDAQTDSSQLSEYSEFKDYLTEDWFEQIITHAQNQQQRVPNPLTHVHS
jgi:hypothetical protein